MVQPGTESVWLWIGTALMALGALAFIGMGWREDDPERQAFFIVTIFIPVIAALSYFSMAMGFGLVELAVPWQEAALDIYWARYADWLFTTPLLLLDLALLAGANRNTIGTLIGLDVGMIVTGFIATIITTSQAMRITWWGISSAFFLVLLYVLVSRLSAQAATQPGDVGDLFGTLRNLTILLWTAYPIVWLIGTEGLALVPLYWETAAFMVLDVTAKVGFGFLLLRSRGTLEASRVETPEAATTTTD
ncbi:bacteriorhodopsin [Halorientalis salina]|uniref:bacteriorhodopsin n=1 Tax=Halorientalis salina TaxID=2932266 RepID=UPI0010ABCA55|nr:bacteriorhodopsin [Halorientalis salina]